MGELLLAEELFLLAHDDESGKGECGLDSSNGYAGALLLDLAAARAITLKGKDVAASATPASPELLEQARCVIAGDDRLRDARHWVDNLPKGLKKIDERIGRALVERGVLGEEHGKTLGLFARTTWPERDPAPERNLRVRLHQVLVTGAEPDTRTAQLIALLHSLGVVRGVVDKADRKQAQARAKQIAEAQVDGAEVSGAVADAVRAVQAAVMAATITPAITAATS